MGLVWDSFSLVLLLLVSACCGYEWALHIPEGHAAAEAIANQQGLENLGEVIPETNIYQFSAKAEHRSKRSVIQSVHQKLDEHPQVKWLEKQEELVRVKREPNPEICFINTEETETRTSKRCIFPFNYKGQTYVKCTSDHSSNQKPWCATEVKSNGDVISGQWGDCDVRTISCYSVSPDGKLLPQTQPSASASLPVQPASAPQRPVSVPQPASAPRRPVARPPPPRQRLPPRPSPRQGLPPNFRPQVDFSGPPRRLPPGGALPPSAPRAPFSIPGLQQQQQQAGPPPGFEFSRSGIPQGLPPRLPFGFPPQGARRPQLVEESEPAIVNRDTRTTLNDNEWPKMWYLNRGNELDMNVEEAWEEGYTGKGVVVTILDDGIEWDHRDLKDNYDPQASTDLNERDPDPYPRYDFINSNKHGTRCAGQVAAVANNSFCSVGVAFDAKVGGVRILDGRIIDVLEAKALGFNRNHIDIYSASWGPDDNGKTVDGPGALARLALKEGVEKGRDGKGSIFVWASGNGGKYLDNCNCDGYTTSIYTFSVSSSSENGLIPWYSESCSSTLATTYSSGSKRLNERKISTTDLHGKCTSSHTGTSASSPMAAGIVALVLEANPDLTWRDVQHLAVRTSRKANLKAEDWSVNGAGYEFSHSYGFGLMDAAAMVRLAKDWETVPEQLNCTTPSALANEEPVVIGANQEATVSINAGSCSAVKAIEHLHLHIQLRSGSKRGDLTVLLKSPSGTTSVLLAPRPFDDVRTGLDQFAKWPMMSVHFWDEAVVPEDSNGRWTLVVRNGGDRDVILNDWRMTFYGTAEEPRPKPEKLQKEGRKMPRKIPAAVDPSLQALLGEVAAVEADEEKEVQRPPIRTFIDPSLQALLDGEEDVTPEDQVEEKADVFVDPALQAILDGGEEEQIDDKIAQDETASETTLTEKTPDDAPTEETTSETETSVVIDGEVMKILVNPDELQAPLEVITALPFETTDDDEEITTTTEFVDSE